MTEQGYIKLHRSILGWEWWSDANTMRVFLWLLLNAQWEDSRFRGFDVPRGSLVTSYNSISQNLDISIKSARVAMEHLKRTGEVTSKRHSHFSIVTIVNWDKFQGLDDENGNHFGNHLDNHEGNLGAIKGQSKGNIKEYKEYKNIKKEEDIVSDVSVSDMEQIQEIFNKTCIFFKPCSVITKTRSDKIKKLLKQFTYEEIKEVFDKANKSAFLQGKNDQGWVASFDWLIEVDNFVKVKDGNFDNTNNVYKGENNNYKKHYYDFDALERETRETKRQFYDFEAIDKEIRAK